MMACWPSTSGARPSDRSLIDGLATTIATVLPIHPHHGHSQHAQLDRLCQQTTHQRGRLDPPTTMPFPTADDVHPLLLTAMSSTIVNLQPGYETTQVFTDDVAPIEWLTNNLIVNFLLHGDVESYNNTCHYEQTQ